MSANDTQVGGSHYNKHSNDQQHWDWVIDNNIPYTLGCATKYLFRWRDKNGIEDLKKARHYVQKTLDKADDIYDINLSSGPIPKYVGEYETLICSLLTSRCRPWEFSNNLEHALGYIDELIRNEESKADTDVYAPIAHREAIRRDEEDDQPTASQLHPG